MLTRAFAVSVLPRRSRLDRSPDGDLPVPHDACRVPRERRPSARIQTFRAVKLRAIALPALLALVVAPAGCSGQCNAKVDATLAYLSITQGSGQTVLCARAEEFLVDSHPVRFTSVTTGEDCPSGCIPSEFCAIEDGSSVSLYWAFGFMDGHLGGECPGLDRSAQSTYPSCSPSGLNHPLTRTAVFRAFVNAQVANGGPFAQCLSDYTR